MELGWTIPLTISNQQNFQELETCSSDVDKLDAFFVKFYTELEFSNMCVVVF